MCIGFRDAVNELVGIFMLSFLVSLVYVGIGTYTTGCGEGLSCKISRVVLAL